MIAAVKSLVRKFLHALARYGTVEAVGTELGGPERYAHWLAVEVDETTSES